MARFDTHIGKSACLGEASLVASDKLMKGPELRQALDPEKRGDAVWPRRYPEQMLVFCSTSSWDVVVARRFCASRRGERRSPQGRTPFGPSCWLRLCRAVALLANFIARREEKQILLPQGGIRMTCPAAADSG